MDENRENGKVAIITGATKGLGRALSLVFAEADYQIIGVYHSDTTAAETLQSEFEEQGFQGTFTKQDITVDGAWNEFDELIKAHRDKEFTVIANACTPFVPKPIHLIEWPEVSGQVDINLKGTFLLLKRTLSLMAKGGSGTVISILTSALNPPAKGFSGYLCAKAALQALTKGIAVEYGGRGIRAFSVSPGFMKTALTDGWSDHLKALANTGGGEMQQPAEVASTILKLAESADTVGAGEDYLIGKS